MKHILTLAVCSFLTMAGLSAAAQAGDQDPILALPDGQVLLSISATERREVEQDMLVATLRYSATNTDARALQDEINKTMAKALALVQKNKKIKVSTGSYNVYEYTEPRTKEKKWRGQQSLTLKSMSAEDVLDMTGALQDMGLQMNGLNYVLAPETAVKVQDDLMEAALMQLQARANRAAKAMGKTRAELRDVSVQGNSAAVARPMLRGAMAMTQSLGAAEMAAPVAAAGESTITLTVSARALIKP